MTNVAEDKPKNEELPDEIAMASRDATDGIRPEFTIGREEAERLKAMEKAFLLRPRISIRLRIVAGYLLCFFLLMATGLINLTTLYQARGRLHFLEISQDLSLDVQQARHLERLEFPSVSNLRAARDSAEKASHLLVAEGVNVLDVAGEQGLIGLNYRLGHYVQLIDDALSMAARSPPDAARARAVAGQLDAQSGEIMDLLRTMKAREADRVGHVLKISQELPFIFGGVMLLIIFWITQLLSKTITDALNRVEHSMQRIVAGDYTLMNPARRYSDELSDLPLAVNRILLELRAREAQVVKADMLASVGAFAAGVSRQLDGVFGTIRARAASVLSEAHAPDQCTQCRALGSILADAQLGQETIAGLLEFTRDDAGDLGPVSLADLVESARAIVQPQMAAVGVTFHAELPGKLPPAQAAFRQLKQVFVNLFHNAVQAMPHGGALTVRAGFLGGERVEITVTDEGVGIPPEVLPRLFDPFFTPSERANVSGLGLSVSYGIVKKLGGEIHVGSVVGRGTTVRLTLPLPA